MGFYFIFLFIIILILLTGSIIPLQGKPFEKIVLLMLIFMAGLREYVGMDFYNYWEMYTAGIADQTIEPGFLLLMKFLRSLNADYHVFFFVFAVLIYLFVYKGIKSFTNNTGNALLIYILIPGLFLNSLSIIRQALAITISFYAFNFLIKENKIKYFLLILIGFSFHYTCLLTVPFHLLAKKYAPKVTIKHYLILIISTFILGQSSALDSIFALLKNFDRYSVYSSYIHIDIFKLFILNSFTCLLLVFKRRLSEKPINDYFIFLTVISLLITNIASSFEYASRFSYFFKIFEIIVVAEIISVFSKNIRMFIMPIIFGYYIGIFYISLVGDASVEEDGPKLIPYYSIFTRGPIN